MKSRKSPLPTLLPYYVGYEDKNNAGQCVWTRVAGLREVYRGCILSSPWGPLKWVWLWELSSSDQADAGFPSAATGNVLIHGDSMCDILSQCVCLPSKLLSPWFPDSLSQCSTLNMERENLPSSKSSLDFKLLSSPKLKKKVLF